MTDYGSTGYGTSPPAEEASPSAKDRAREVAGAAASEAGGVASTAVEQTKSVASAAVDQTRAVAGDAKQQAGRLGQEAKTQLRGQVDEQTKRVTRGLDDVGQQLRTMADKADDPESAVSRYTRQAADSVQQLALRLDDGGLDRAVDDVKGFARNRPGVFLLGALGAGVVVGRLVKAVDLGEVVKGSTNGDDATDLTGSTPQHALDVPPAWDTDDQSGSELPAAESDPSGPFSTDPVAETPSFPPAAVQDEWAER
jgi:hypothetical protein